MLTRSKDPEVEARQAELTRLSKILARREIELEDARKSLLATFNRRYFEADRR